MAAAAAAKTTIPLYYKGKIRLDVTDSMSVDGDIPSAFLYEELEKTPFRGTLFTASGVSILKNVLHYAPPDVRQGLFLKDHIETYGLRLSNYFNSDPAKAGRPNNNIIVPVVVAVGTPVTGEKLYNAIRSMGYADAEIKLRRMDTDTYVKYDDVFTFTHEDLTKFVLESKRPTVRFAAGGARKRGTRSRSRGKSRDRSRSAGRPRSNKK